MSSESARRAKLYSLLGELPLRDRPISARVIEKRKSPRYRLERLELDLNGIEPVPAFFLSSRETGPERRPVVLYNHAHGGDWTIGKEEAIAGRDGLQAPPYADVLASLGCSVLCIDHWNFGERRGRTESALFKELIWKGQVLWGLMVYDSLRAVDYLVSRPDVDPDRIATLGMSMGSTMAWWLAALDGRIKVTIDLCCLTDFQSLIASRGLDGHGIYYFVPGLLKEFSSADINALIAPRPHLSLAGIHDPLTPPAGLDAIDQVLTQVYAEAGAPDAWKLIRFPSGHFETAAMREAATSFLVRWI